MYDPVLAGKQVAEQGNAGNHNVGKKSKVSIMAMPVKAVVAKIIWPRKVETRLVEVNPLAIWHISKTVATLGADTMMVTWQWRMSAAQSACHKGPIILRVTGWGKDICQLMMPGIASTGSTCLRFLKSKVRLVQNALGPRS
jgi:hypothetical protein